MWRKRIFSQPAISVISCVCDFLCYHIRCVWLPPLESGSTAALRAILPLAGEKLLCVWASWAHLGEQAGRLSPCITNSGLQRLFQKGSASEQESNMPRDRSSVPVLPASPHLQGWKSSLILLWWCVAKIRNSYGRPCLKFRLVQQRRLCHIEHQDQVHCMLHLCQDTGIAGMFGMWAKGDKWPVADFSYEKEWLLKWSCMFIWTYVLVWSYDTKIRAK